MRACLAVQFGNRHSAFGNGGYLRWFPCFFGSCTCFLGGLTSRWMAISVGEKVPEFTLAAANRFQQGEPERVALTDLLRRGPAILEFLRGTW